MTGNVDIGLQGKYHKVIFDNFFSSVSLLKELKKKFWLMELYHQIGKICRSQLMKSHSKEATLTLSALQMDSVSINENTSKPVQLISNYHKIETATVQRKQKDGAKGTIICPQVVKDYNQNMCGVDKHDMLRQLYEINRKNMKWWHRLVFGLLGMAVVNTHVVHNASKEQQLLFLEFRRDLAMELLTRTFARGCRSSGVPKSVK